MFLTKRVCSLVRNNNLNNKINISINAISYYSTSSGSKKSTTNNVSSNIKKLIKKPKRSVSSTKGGTTKSKGASGFKELLAKYTLENLEDENDNPTYDEIDEGEDEDEEFQFDTQLNFDINQDPLYKKHMEQALKEEELEKERKKQRELYEKEEQEKQKSYYDQTEAFKIEDKKSIDEDMRLEFWARQMALRDSLKNDGGRYLLDETAYLEPIKNYKLLGRKLMKRRQDEKEKENEEKRLLKQRLQKQKLDQLGLSQEDATKIELENKKLKLKSKQALKELLTPDEFQQLENQQKLMKLENQSENEDYGIEMDDGEDGDKEIEDSIVGEEEEEEDIGLPNLSRLHPYTSVPAPIEIVQELLDIRKQDLIKQTEQASDEFEKRRRIKRIEFMAKKKELQHKQMVERHTRMGFNDSVIKGDDNLPIEIDPKVFSRFQSGEITEQEMMEISKNQNKIEREMMLNEQQDIDNDEEENGDEIKSNSRKNTEFLRHWKIGSIGIPPLLKKKITSVIKEYPTQQLRNDAALLSENLRDRTRLGKAIGSPAVVTNPDEKPVITYGKGQALAYISHRMPGVYSCTHRVFSEINSRLPNFKPTSILDYGSGPGTVLWSADTIWGDSIKKIKAIEPSTHMTEVAKKLLEGNTNRVRWSPYLNTDSIKRADGSIPESELSEMVTASYVLSELPNQEARNNLVLELWSHVKPSGILVLIEPGTPVGFGIIKEVRQLVLDQEAQAHSIYKSTKAQVVSPCPHSGKCPMGAFSWCHFSQRVERPIFQKLAKGPGSTMPYEDEKYSYIVLSKVISSSIPNQLEKQNEIYSPEELLPTKQWSRINEAPLKRGGHIILDVCSPSGELNRVTVAKSHGKKIYKEARKSFWSDGFILDESVVDYRHGRFNTSEEEEAEQLRLEQEELNKHNKKNQQVKEKKNKTSIEILEDLEKGKDGNQLSKKEKKEKEKSKDWMKDLQGGDRKILEKLIKQGKFSEESTGLFGQEEADNGGITQQSPQLPQPASDYGTSEMALGFAEDINDFDEEEDELDQKQKQKKSIYDLNETSKSRKNRKMKLLQDLNKLKKQEMSPEERKLQELKEEEIRNQRKSYKESNPKNIEYYLKDFDNESPLDKQEIENRFKSRLEHQKEMQETFKNVASKTGLSITSKSTREKLLEKKLQTEKFKKDSKLKKKYGDNDDVENVD